MTHLKSWSEIYSQLVHDAQDQAMEPGALEQLALAAYLTGKDEESIEKYEQAHKLYLDRDEIPESVRCAFWLGLILVNTVEKARSSGWFARGERLLEKIESDIPEKGLFMIPKALRSLFSGNISDAETSFKEALAIGEKFDDPDLINLARLGYGQTLFKKNNVEEGGKIFDELMISLQTEDVYPIVVGIVYCAVVETCRKVWDLSRAKEWTQALNRWCSAQPDIIPFRGQCLVRRAEIIQLHGNLEKALDESDTACQLLIRPPGEPAAGEAFYRKAELLRILGSFEEAERSYNDAAKWKRSPFPGLAKLRIAQDRSKEALKSLQHALQETNDPNRRADLLPTAIQLYLADGNMTQAKEYCLELHTIVKEIKTPYLQAMSYHCKGILHLSKKEHPLALKYLKKATRIWELLDLPYELAQSREIKGAVYQELKDQENSMIEYSSAKWIYQQLSAKYDGERLHRLSKKSLTQEKHDLTLRELQVLRHITKGETNRSIADELFISERTVDRHVSNIFKKLNISSRVEAATYAVKNNLAESDPL